MRFFLLLCFLFTSCGFFYEPAAREHAEKHASNKEYDKAIAEYKKHIEDRLTIKERPEWENPYIYYLDIGDLYLEQDSVQKAIDAYLYARKNAVKESYVADRLRNIALYYEKKNDIKAAIEHLEKYRESDPLMFDLMLDRLARQLVAEEDQK